MGLSDIGDFLVPEAVENAAGAVTGGAADLGVGIAHGAQTAAGVVGDVAKGAGWVANPYHWDDIQHGIGAAGSFIVNNPGKTWDIGFEVGRHIVKEEILDPQNLAINLGMLAATTLTGGGAGAAWAAKIGKGVRSGASAMRAARASGEGMSVARGVRAATETMRASDAAFKVARAERLGASGLRAADTVADATSAAGRLGQKVTDVAEFMPRQFAKVRQHVTGEELGYVARGRQSLARSFEGESPGMLREMVGDVIRSPPFRPGTAGLGTGGSKLARATYSVKRGEENVSHVQAVETASDVGEEAYQFQKNPEAYVAKKAGVAGADITALRAGYNMLRQGKKLNDALGEEEDQPKKRAARSRPPKAEYAPISAPEASVSSYRGRGPQRGPGTSRSEYVESDFTVERDRLAEFQHGIYDPRSIYEQAGAR